MKQLTHLSLFSGIGGLDLAAEMAGIETIGQCEWADYPTKILERHWPGVARWRDIRTLTQESFYAKTGRRTVDVISGGFPCQPFSVAGSRKGRADDRFLWPEMLRVIRELRPTWVIGENVGGLVSMAERIGRPSVESRTITRYEDEDFYGAVLVQQEKMLLVEILEDIRSLGYDVQAFVVPAAGVGAPHRRDRIAIVARHADRDAQSPDACLWQGEDAKPGGVRGDAADADGLGRGSRWPEQPGQQGVSQITGCGDDVGDAEHDGLLAAAVAGGTFETGDDGTQGAYSPGEPTGTGRSGNRATMADAYHAERRAQRSTRRGLEERPDGLPQRQKGSGGSERRRENVAYAESERCGEAREHRADSEKRPSGSGEDVQHAIGKRREEFDTSGQSGRSGFAGRGCSADAADAERTGLEECNCFRMGEPEKHPEPEQAHRVRLRRRIKSGSAQWAVEPAVGRVAHGIPHRVDSLKCLGNAVVPQQFYPFFAAIVAVESEAA